MRYPYIYSLSTVNLIYHGNLNYRLNPVSTSFVADSGVGKSVLADLLQLIFVGPGRYKSSTQAKGGRPFHTLVQGSSQGTGRGYAFMNIQLGPSEFLLVGCLLEVATQHCTPFVVQQGEDFRIGKVRPLVQPLGWEAFVDAEGNVPTLKPLSAQLELINEVVLREYDDKLAAYLQFLWENNLVPLDLSKPKLLKDYAQIIRSFARSGELNKNPEYLEDFLFGDEAKTRIAKQHIALLHDISHDQKNYSDNSRRIEKIKDKIKRFTELDSLKATFHALQRQQLQQAWYTAYHEYNTNEKQQQQAQVIVQDLRKQVLQRKSAYYQRLLDDSMAQAQRFRADRQRRKALPALLEAAEDQQRRANDRAEATQTAKRTAAAELEKAEQVAIWLKNWGPDYDSLRQHWQQQQTAALNRERSSHLWQHLQQTQQADNLQALGWHQGCSASQLNHDLEIWKQRAVEAHAVASYVDADRPDSLAYWALNHPTPLTLEQESVLAHFGQLAHWRGQEVQSARFLEAADLLLHDAMQTKKGASATGFWLCLAGTREWISWVPDNQRLFNKPNKAETRALLADWQMRRANEAATRQRQCDIAAAVLQALQDFTQWEAALPLLPTVDQAPIPALPNAPASLPELNAAIVLHSKLATLQHDTKLANEVAEEAKTAHAAAIANAANLRTEENHLKNTPANRAEKAASLWTARRELRTVRQQATDWGIIVPPETITADLAALMTAQTDLATETGNLAKFRDAHESLHTAEQDARTAYYVILTAEQQIPNEPQSVSDCPTALAVERAYTDYRNTFRDAIKDYLGEDQTEIYLTGDHLVEFLREVLPQEVRGVIGSTAEGQARLHRAMHDINEINRDIARRKFSELSFLIGDVRNAADDYFREILQLQSYFQREKTEITGGFRPFIQAHTTSKYPLDWLTEFQQLAADPVAFEQSAQTGTLDDILLHAFRQRKGTDEKATVADILNPVRYIKLDFEMRDADGQANDGSNGQTFMAVALLNIARLAVIGRSGGASTAPRRLRFMVVDEAHDLGTNYWTLRELASKEGFQFISLSIRPLTHHTGPHQRLYFLRMGRNKTLRHNLPPLLLSRGESVPAANEPFAPPAPPDLFTPTSNQDAEA
ncbi:hypothetical protein GCM10028822_00090 [Hymenobacter terrigena]